METEYLPTTSYVILGLLTFREMSGYDLKQLINKSITHFYWSPAKSQIYGELRRLESHGLVTMREVPQTLRPDKRLYQITPEGTEAMQQWLRSSGVEADSYKSALLLKVFFGHMLSYDTTIGLLEERRKQIAQELVMCERRSQEFQEKCAALRPMTRPFSRSSRCGAVLRCVRRTWSGLTVLLGNSGNGRCTPVPAEEGAKPRRMARAAACVRCSSVPCYEADRTAICRLSRALPNAC